MKFRLPYHLITEHDTFETLDELNKRTNPKLRKNFLINRCIKLALHVVRYADQEPSFKSSLNIMLGTNDFKKFFFRGGI